MMGVGAISYQPLSDILAFLSQEQSIEDVKVEPVRSFFASPLSRETPIHSARI